MRAPAFALQDTNGTMVRLADLTGKTVILYFYPKDNTPGCTIEAREFSTRLPAFAKKNAVVYGVSKDSVQSHRKFTDLCGLSVPLLCDPDGKVCEAYGVLAQKRFMGRTYTGIVRTTIVIGPDGMIRKRYDNVTALGHAQQVLDDLPTARSPSSRNAR